MLAFERLEMIPKLTNVTILECVWSGWCHGFFFSDRVRFTVTSSRQQTSFRETGCVAFRRRVCVIGVVLHCFFANNPSRQVLREPNYPFKCLSGSCTGMKKSHCKPHPQTTSTPATRQSDVRQSVRSPLINEAEFNSHTIQVEPL